jgi:hypothetical protein
LRFAPLESWPSWPPDAAARTNPLPRQDRNGFAARFSKYKPAPEPNGDLAKVVWPDYVLEAPPEVKQLYEF